MLISAPLYVQRAQSMTASSQSSTSMAQTTQLDSSIPIVVPQHLGLASEMLDGNIYLNSYIVSYVRQHISGLANYLPSQDLSSSDISYTILPDSINNKSGSLSINISILNHKAWVDGEIVECYSFNNQSYLVSGFKQRNETSLKQSRILVDSKYQHQAASSMTPQALKAYILEHLDEILDSYPRSNWCDHNIRFSAQW